MLERAIKTAELALFVLYLGSRSYYIQHLYRCRATPSYTTYDGNGVRKVTGRSGQEIRCL